LSQYYFVDIDLFLFVYYKSLFLILVLLSTVAETGRKDIERQEGPQDHRGTHDL